MVQETQAIEMEKVAISRGQLAAAESNNATVEETPPDSPANEDKVWKKSFLSTYIVHYIINILVYGC
jgi:hypothetical protein